MDELLNEHEQGERVRSWLQRNAVGLLGGMLAGIGLIWGWTWWQGRETAEDAAIATRYDAFEQALITDPKQAAKQTGALAGTPYAGVAALTLAKAQVDAGDEAGALATLQAAKPADPMQARIVRQRTAQLLVSTGKPADAVQLLGKADDVASLETLGDAQAKLGKASEAQQAYRQALRQVEEGSPERQVLELKLAEAGSQASGA